ncbi:MAG: hypothetical protein AB7E04_07480 [Desulfobacteraceae bacterium]
MKRFYNSCKVKKLFFKALSLMETKQVFVFFLICFIVLASNVRTATANGPLYYLDIAIQLRKNKYYDRAHEVLNYGIRKYPNAHQLYLERGALRYRNLRDFVGAINDYTVFLKLDKSNRQNHTKIFLNRGVCLYLIGQYRLSIKSFTHSIQLNPKYSKPYLWRAKAYGKLGLINKAMKDLNKVSKISPKYNRAINDLRNQIYLNKSY